MLTLPHFDLVEIVTFRTHTTVPMRLLAVRVGVHFLILGSLISLIDLLILHLALDDVELAEARALDLVFSH